MVRGYSITEKKTVYGYLFIAKDNKGNSQTQILQQDNLIGLQKMYVISPESLEQYVNYNDTDKKPIYENDMLEGNLILDNGEIECVTGWAIIYKGTACIRTKDQKIPLLFIDDLKIVENDGRFNIEKEAGCETKEALEAAQNASRLFAQTGCAVQELGQIAESYRKKNEEKTKDNESNLIKLQTNKEG